MCKVRNFRISVGKAGVEVGKVALRSLVESCYGVSEATVVSPGVVDVIVTEDGVTRRGLKNEILSLLFERENPFDLIHEGYE